MLLLAGDIEIEPYYGPGAIAVDDIMTEFAPYTGA